MTVVVKPNLQDLIGARLKPDRTTEFYSSAGVVRMGSVRLRSDYSLAHVGSLSASCGGGSDSRTVDKVGLVGYIFRQKACSKVTQTRLRDINFGVPCQVTIIPTPDGMHPIPNHLSPG